MRLQFTVLEGQSLLNELYKQYDRKYVNMFYTPITLFTWFCKEKVIYRLFLRKYWKNVILAQNLNLLCLKSNYVYPKMQIVTNVCFAAEYIAEKIEPAFLQDWIQCGNNMIACVRRRRTLPGLDVTAECWEALDRIE